MATETKTYGLMAEPREIKGKASLKLRKQGIVPGVVYGHRVESESVQVIKKELEHVYLRAGSNSLIDLTVGDGNKARKVFIHNVQRSAVGHELTHVDFLAVNLREEMTANVPISLIGESPAVEKREGLLISQTEHVLIKALPMDVPSVFEVDISGLDEVGKAIYVSDLKIPENVTLLTPTDELIVRINELSRAQAADVEEAAAEAAEAAAESAAASEAEAEVSE